MKSKLFEKIEELIIEMRGSYKKPFTDLTTLEKDLKITGDDAWEFIEAFGKEFKIDISDFDYSKYFASEGSFEIYKLLLFGKSTGKTPLSLGELEQAVKKGKLE